MKVKTIESAELALLRHVLSMYAKGHDDAGREARKALRATAPKRNRKSRR